MQGHIITQLAPNSNRQKRPAWALGSTSPHRPSKANKENRAEELWEELEQLVPKAVNSIAENDTPSICTTEHSDGDSADDDDSSSNEPDRSTEGDDEQAIDREVASILELESNNGPIFPAMCGVLEEVTPDGDVLFECSQSDGHRYVVTSSDKLRNASTRFEALLSPTGRENYKVRLPNDAGLAIADLCSLIEYGTFYSENLATEQLDHLVCIAAAAKKWCCTKSLKSKVKRELEIALEEINVHKDPKDVGLALARLACAAYLLDQRYLFSQVATRLTMSYDGDYFDLREATKCDLLPHSFYRKFPHLSKGA